MKKAFILIIAAVILTAIVACGAAPQNVPRESINRTHSIEPTPQLSFLPKPASEASSMEGEKSNNMTNISITVGDSIFSAKLYDNDTTKALLKQFPLTLKMSELNGNEKYYYLSDKLPTSSERVGNIKNGDLMLYGSDCLVLFYEGFSTSYSYTRLGYVVDASGLDTALGDGSIEVTFAVSK